ncbi:MgtC/SapB family protein [Nocardia sp. NEAU-G5]|uniref:MgtC/SapB family protein n=1 Tax=Nocardia albiluteola TaxID=2842303 RepID=A0ABS6B2E7_9NOCA|nr:MgtC/SapB family protein [Nocardia albiluteola]MBU3064476.1 MgtC/SapB family protein [Nocardia albiluteola]
MTTVEMLLRLGAGVGLGAVIGVERQYRARMAGLRTNALVAAGSTLFVLLSAHGFHGTSADPTRVAAQIVSGIGFLGAGVIMREGLSVRGLNTAATLWCSAAVGALSGSGMYGTALAGTIVVVAVNTVMRYIGRAVDRQPTAGTEQLAQYQFAAVTDDANEAHVRALLVQALSRTGFRLVSISSKNAGAGQVGVTAELIGDERDDRQMESAVSALSLEPSVTSVGWSIPHTATPEVEH